MRISRRGQVPSFKVMDILTRVAQLRAAGKPVISLSAGEPAAGAPGDVRAAAAQVQQSGVHLGYTATAGRLELRQELVGHYRRWYGLELTPEDFFITTGASGAFLLTFLAAFDAGDRVALARPGYPAYRNILASVDCVPVDIPAGAQTRFQPTVAALEAEVAVNDPLAGLIIASPANPTGTMIDPAEFQAISRWCVAHDVLLISDEIYHGITYPGSSNTSDDADDDTTDDDVDSPAQVCGWQLSRDHVVISSFSKFWGMPGDRVGWMLLPEWLRGQVDALAGNIALCAPHAAQLAAVAGFTEDSYVQSFAQVEQYEANRRLLVEALPGLGFGEPAPADGAFYMFLPLGELAGAFTDASAYCAALLEQEFVAVVPGTDFDPVDGAGFVRISFAVSTKDMVEAIRRMTAFNRAIVQENRER